MLNIFIFIIASIAHCFAPKRARRTRVARVNVAALDYTFNGKPVTRGEAVIVPVKLGYDIRTICDLEIEATIAQAPAKWENGPFVVAVSPVIVR